MKISKVQEDVCGFANLLNANMRCKKGTSWKKSVIQFSIINPLVNVYKLRKSLIDGTYKISKYSVFTISEPKKRLIVSSKYVDRVFHTSFCDNYFTDKIRSTFIYDNGACLKGKGCEFERKRLYTHIRKHFNKHGFVGGYLVIDVKDFFGSTLHSVAHQVILKAITDEWARSIHKDVCDSFTQGEDKNKGMGLGSPISQITQLKVLDSVDHYAKEVLKLKHYVRYMDDIIIVHNDIEYLKKCKKIIEERINRLHLIVSPKKVKIIPINNCVHFLGFSFRLLQNGKIVVKLLPKKISHYRRKLKKLVAKCMRGEMTRQEVNECYKSFISHISGKSRKKPNFNMHRDTHSLVLAFDKYYKKLWEDMKNEGVNGARCVAKTNAKNK